ncbi:MAG: DUF1800 domain-containing protein, partial [Ardenticatenales bacterium]
VAEWLRRPRVAWAAGRTRPMPAPSAARHLLARATFGMRPGDAERVEAMGAGTWLDAQLDRAVAASAGADPVVDAALAPLETLRWTAEQIQAASNDIAQRARIRDELVAATLYRIVHSPHQLFEVMVDHWANHFNVYMDDYHMMMQSVADRDVLRRHAITTFRPMLHADAADVAMMQYLTTLQNTKRGPNENYAREVMELHTLGVGGGYSEADIKAVAKCFTGWNRSDHAWRFEFRPDDHDAGAKTIFGEAIRATGVDEGHEVLDRLVDHPSCAAHVARRLCRRLVADQPPDALVARVAAAFGRDGEVAGMLRALFTSPEFAAAVVDRGTAGGAGDGTGGPAKIRRPMEHWAAVLRGLGADAGFLLTIPKDGDYAGRPERYLQLMAHMPFRWRSPDGYPDAGRRWNGAHIMLSRWNFGLAAAENRLGGVDIDLTEQMAADAVPNQADAIVDYWADRLLPRPLLPADRAVLVEDVAAGGTGRVTLAEAAQRVPMTVALLIDSPYFQWR